MGRALDSCGNESNGLLVGPFQSRGKSLRSFPIERRSRKSCSTLRSWYNSIPKQRFPAYRYGATRARFVATGCTKRALRECGYCLRGANATARYVPEELKVKGE